MELNCRGLVAVYDARIENGDATVTLNQRPADKQVAEAAMTDWIVHPTVVNAVFVLLTDSRNSPTISGVVVPAISRWPAVQEVPTSEADGLCPAF